MPAGDLRPIHRRVTRPLAAAAVLAGFMAGASVAHAQQSSGTLAVSVTVVRSATIATSGTDLLSGTSAPRAQGSSVTVRHGAMTTTFPAGAASPAVATSGNRVPLVSPAANGRTLSIQF
jgi:hypothetical protein